MQQHAYITDAFCEAARDYLFLKERLYPEKQSLKLVGDKFRLDKQQRMILYRGIVSRRLAGVRKARLTDTIQGRHLLMDGYNILYALVNYLMGKPLFIANDGLLRDCGGAYGDIEDPLLMKRAVTLLAQYLRLLGPSSAVLFLDSPVPRSGLHRQWWESVRRDLQVKTTFSQSADRAAIAAATEGDIIATSDSGILEATPDCPIFDLPRYIIGSSFNSRPPDLSRLF